MSSLVTPQAKTPLLLVARRRQDEDQDRAGMAMLHLLGPVDLDLEHQIGVDLGVEELPVGYGRAVVVAEELGPLEEAAGLDSLSRTRTAW